MEIKKVLEFSVNCNRPLLLIGETGTGKTTIIREYADKLEKKLVRINLNGQTGREDLLGKNTLQDGNVIFQKGVLYSALENGHWILLDEINACLPEISLVLQALLEVRENTLGNVLITENKGEVLTPHKDCRIFATMNPPTYAGTKDLNMAFQSRFVIAEVQPLTPAKESSLLEKRYNIEKNIATLLAKLGQHSRTAKQQGLLNLFVSTRDLEVIAEMISNGFDLPDSLEIGLLGKATSDVDKRELEKIIKLIAGIDISTIKPFDDLEDILRQKEIKIKELETELSEIRVFKESLKEIAKKIV